MSAQIPATHERQAISLFQRDIVKRALIDSLKKLDPRVQVRNPVMFVVEIGSVITTGVAVLLEAEHMCMSLRGVEKLGALTVTTHFTGAFRDDSNEQVRFMTLLRGGQR